MNTSCKAGLIGLAGSMVLSLGACSSVVQTSSIPMTTAPAATMLKKHADATCKPDLIFGLSQSSITLTAGQTKNVGFSVHSLCGLSGLVIVLVRSVSPTPGPTHHQCCYDFHLPPNGSTGNFITFGATSATAKATYTITVTANGPAVEHSATLLLTVT